MKLVILDSYALEPGDLDWSPLYELADEIESYPRTQPHEIIPRLADADFAILNKAHINDAVLTACPRLRWVGVTATGTDSLDIAACRRHNVAVANVPGYSTHSVAQLALTLLLSLCQCPARHDAAVRKGYWQLEVPPAYGILPQREVDGKTIGLIGYGAIAQQMAKVCLALGMQVLCHTRTVRAEYRKDGVVFVEPDRLWRDSDYISLHCPATPQTVGIVNEKSLAQCKKGVLIVNTARGALVDEAALAAALQTGQVGGFAADVVSHEPILPDNPLLFAPRVILTPHIAWATPEALARLAHEVILNLRSFLTGGDRNVVN